MEHWKAVPGYRGIEASTLGRIRTVDRVVPRNTKKGPRPFTLKGKVLKPWLGSEKGKYDAVGVTPELTGKQTTVGVHQLVCLAFHGEPPSEQHFACHKNDDRANNTPHNLYWGTRKSNAEDAGKNLRTAKGSKHGSAKLTEQQVQEIRSRYTPRHPIDGVKPMAAEFGVSETHMSRIVRGVKFQM